MKKLLICVVAIDAFPSFFRDDARLSAITEAGHAVACLCPEGTGEMAREWKRGHDNVVIAEYEDTETGVIRAVNELLDTSFDWHGHDLLIVNNTDCELAPDILASMQERMYAFDRYAIGNPRMNIDGWVNLREEDAALAQSSFPAITRLPFPTSACAYIKGLHVSRFGPFSDAYQSLEASLCDFAIKINEYGFDTVMLNHEFISADTSNAHPPAMVNEKHPDHEALLARYAYFDDIVYRFEIIGRDPVDHFKDVIAPPASRKPRILLDYSNLPPVNVGTSEYQMNLLRYLAKHYQDKYELWVFASKEGAEYHHVENYCNNIVFEEEDLGIYDLGLYAAQPTDMLQQVFLNRHCARTVYNVFDSIQLRCSYINYTRNDAVASIETVRFGLENCDGIMNISDYSQQDMLDYFQDDEAIRNKPLRRIYIANDFGTLPPRDSQPLATPIPFDDYVLVAGNPWFKHKALSETIEALKGANENFVIIGCFENGYIHPNMYGLKYGHLSEGALLEIYQKCKLFVFPSLYEGFGLPIVNALKCGKNVIVADNPLNRELAEYLAVGPENMVFFDTFDELPQTVRQALLASPPEFEYENSWGDFARALSEFIDELIAKPIDCERLRHRNHQYAVHWQMLERNRREVLMDLRISSLLKYRASEKEYKVKHKVYKRLIESNPQRLKAWRTLKRIGGRPDDDS